jgi:hypothetical protein
VTVCRFKTSLYAWYFLSVTAFVLSSAACERLHPPMPTLAKQVRPVCPPASDREYYFPDATISPIRAFDLFYQSEYSRYLSVSSAPSISCLGTVQEEYRLLWIPSNRPAGMISVSRRGDGWVVASIEFVDPMKQNPRWVLQKRTDSHLTNDDVQPLIAALQTGGFWTTLSSEASSGEGGEPWIVEGRTKTGYHAVTRISLYDATFKALGFPFFTVARRPLPERTASRQDGPH